MVADDDRGAGVAADLQRLLDGCQDVVRLVAHMGDVDAARLAQGLGDGDHLVRRRHRVGRVVEAGRESGRALGQRLGEAIEQMRGPAGSRVRLTVRRAGSGELVDVSLERTRVEVHSVSGEMLDPTHAYIRIVSFSDTTASDFDTVVKSLQKSHKLEGVVLDLRNNPGGVLEAAVAVADALLDTGNIVSAEGRAPDARFRMDAKIGRAHV